MSAAAPTDEALRLNWIREPQSVQVGGAFLKDWVRENSEHCSEEDTRAVVEAVLRGLGWDTLTGEVAREGDVRLGDFHLYYGGAGPRGSGKARRRIAVLIEAKRLEARPAQLRRHPFQELVGYVRSLSDPGSLPAKERAWVEGVQLAARGDVFIRGVLTTGRLWWVYDFTHAQPSPDGGLLHLDLAESSVAGLQELLTVLGKEHICSEVEKFFRR